MASSSSSVVPTRRKGWTYDVFLSFRGEDVRNNFVDHLFAALVRNGIHTFKDDKMLGGGQPISQELVKAIKESRFAVVVFSKNYANSSWCLEELSKIMECHKQMTGQKKVLPVFYHVNPSDVRKQKGDFATAFETHEDKFKGQMEKVSKWREALTAAANLSGQHILPLNGGEAAFISTIVQQILADKQPCGDRRENHLIGIQPRINALISLLKMEATEEVRILGIWGMGGIGKTTIARALFKRIAHKFQGSSFVTNVRENSSSKKDICALQQKILQDILGSSSGVGIHDPEDGGEEIQERCCRKKVLLVLDDVNDAEQLEFLAATREWFGPGSRIIITTRDQHLLSYANANDKYSPALLHTDQALELFSRHAFRKSSPPDGYMDLTNRAISYTHRLPLALKVLGSFLCGREASVWGSALDTLAKTPSAEVFDTLKLSYDYLNDFEKKIFLDIACFYKGEDVDEVTRILDSCRFHPVIGISVLVEKSLITISSRNTLEMHDLIQEMGRKVVQASAPNSRLWELEKIHDLINKKELEVIESIVLPWIQNMKSLRADVFKGMKNLRVLHCYGKFTACKPRFLPDGLRWFHWWGYPFSSLPVAHMSKLVGLEMDHGKIKHLWKVGEKIMLPNLKFIDLGGCNSLKRFPDVSGAPNIESLDLGGCENMVEVDESVGSLKKLLHLDMIICFKLECLPSMLKMESLETLILWDCHSLKRIPEFSPCMVNLSKLDIRNCYEIEEVPSSIKYLSNLKELKLNGCISLEKLPDDFQSMESLEELHVDSIHIHDFTNSCCLRKLHLFGELQDNEFPKNVHGLSSLEELHIEDNWDLIQLPETISHLSSLKSLSILSCRGLETLGGLPPGIQVLTVKYCESLEKIEDLSKEYKCLNKIRISGCRKLLEDEENGRYLEKMSDQSFIKTLILSQCYSLKRIPEFSPCMVNLSKLDISECREIEEVPSSIKYLSNLKKLKLDRCSIEKLPDDFQSMESLEELHIDSIHIHAFTNSCNYLRKLYLYRDNDFPKNLHGLSSLEELHISWNSKLIQLPESISHLSTLKHLMIRDYRGLQTLGGLPPGIQVLTVECCKSLEKIEDLSKEYKCLNKIQFLDCPKLLEDEENGIYLEKMLDQSFIKKWAAVDGCLIIEIPGSNIPSWFKEQQDGCKIALKLPLQWQTQIIGFAICFVSVKRISYPMISMNLRFANDEMLVSKSEADNINETVQDAYWNLWTGYIPYSLFEKFHGGNDSNFEGEDWFRMTEDNLVFEISGYNSEHVVRCGAKVVYKEDVESIQQTIPSISSFFWSWKLTKDEFTNSFECRVD